MNRSHFALPLLCTIPLLLHTPAARATTPAWSALGHTSNAPAIGPNNEVNTLLVAPATPNSPQRLLVGGLFTAINGSNVSSPHLIAWDGSLWQPGPGLQSEVQSLVIHPISGVPTVVASGTSDLVTPPTGAPIFTAYSVAFLDNGSWTGVNVPGAGYVFGMGSYQLAGDAAPQLALSSPFFLPSEYIAEMGNLATSGSPPVVSAALDGLGGGLITVTRAFCQFDDGQGPRLYAGAGANSSQTLGMLARYDGTEWTNLTGFSGQVNAMLVFDDGTGPAMYVAGSFTHIAGNTACNRIAKYKNGVFTPLATGLNNQVNALAVHDDGTGPAIYAAGYFSSASGTLANRIAKWQNGQWHALAGGLGTAGNAQYVNALASFDDDGDGPMPPALYAAGTFTSADGQPALRIARWGKSFCTIDLDNGSASGTPDFAVDINDLLFFLVQFEAGSTEADLDNDGEPTNSIRDGAVDINDLLFFLARFEAGC